MRTTNGQKVNPTRTDSTGTGYYNVGGKMYYGNPQNGYLKETIEERSKRMAREQAQQRPASAGADDSFKRQWKEGAAAALSEDSRPSLLGGIAALFAGAAVFIATVAVMGVTAIIAAVLGIIGTAIGIVMQWTKAYSIIISTFADFGINLETILLTLPMILSLGVLVLLLVKTFTKHKLYAVHLLVAYMILFLPYAFLMCGGMVAISEGLMTVSGFIGADLNYTLSCGIFPAIAMYLLHKLDIKVQLKKAEKEKEIIVSA